MADAKRMNPHQERQVAVKAGVDPRTVRAYVEGRNVRSTVASRVAEALRELGFAVTPQPQPEEESPHAPVT
jgi:DNA-binding LacI/PurR family transcriptional regulator